MPSPPVAPTTAKYEKDLTKENPTRNKTIEELKLKLESKEIGLDKDGAVGMIPESHRGVPHPPAPPLLSEDGLIVPRKPPNPVKENTDRQNLHKELLFNQKIGKNVLNQKSELQRALERQKDNLAKKELESNIASNTPELKKVIESRARKLQEGEQDKDETADKSINKEFIEARMKLKTRSD